MLFPNKIKIIQGDITEQDVDVIVNPANPRLSSGGGLSGYIHQKAGPGLVLVNLTKLKELGKKYLGVGGPVVTDGLKLKQKIIHVVGPKYHLNENNWKELLKKCYINSLILAENEGYRTIAFPSISTGIYGCPTKGACPIVLDSIAKYLEDSSIKEVRLVLFDDEDYKIYRGVFNGVL